MDIVPRMGLLERRHLINVGRKSGDPATALRFFAVARLGLGHSTVRVAASIELARSTVVKAAERYRADGIEGLYDRRGRGSCSACRWSTKGTLRSPSARWAACSRAFALGLAFRSPSCSARGRRTRASAGWRRFDGSSVARRARSRSSTATRSTSISIRRSDATGCFAVSSAKSARLGRTRSSTPPGRSTWRGGVLHSTGADRKNSELFCALLRLLAEEYLNARRIHLIVDNYGIHSAHTRPAAPSRSSVAASCCISSCRTVPMRIASSASGRTFTQT